MNVRKKNSIEVWLRLTYLCQASHKTIAFFLEVLQLQRSQPHEHGISVVNFSSNEGRHTQVRRSLARSKNMR